MQLTTGESVNADEAYVRESILNPGAKIVAGYQNIMPTFQGQVTEEDLLQLIEYIKSLAKQRGQGDYRARRNSAGARAARNHTSSRGARANQKSLIL